jgi:very-short-patch-repair endonuclease
MKEAETTQTTPLQNLFFYIRDLFNTSDYCYDFEKEKNNEKSEEKNYWKIDKLISLSQKCEQRNIKEFSFPVENIEYIIKVKRIDIPTEPQLPFDLNDWTITNRSTGIPTVTFKTQLETLEKFENSDKRINDLERFKEQSQTSLFEQTLPPSLDGWINFVNNQPIPIKEKKAIVLFSDNASRVKQAEKYKKEFDEFHAKYEVPFKTNKVYDALHTLHYELKGRDNRKLYISFGLVSGKIGNQSYRNFLFNVPLKISLKSQEITIETDTFSSKIFCEQYFVELFDSHFKNEHTSVIEERKKEVLLSIDNFNSKQKEFLFDNEFLRSEYYNVGIEILSAFVNKKDVFFSGEKLNYEFENANESDRVTFSFSPIIQTKIVESQISISKDANNIINKINELQSLGDLHLIPDFFKKLFSIDGLGIATENTTSNQQTSESGSLNGIKHRSLFPLPYNDEQFEIVKRLNEQDAVTVKGPPGTGKSHTIANLISHYVAQGKSILVVSHNAKALSVLKDKLPKSIQELAVSLVNDGKGNENLKASVNAIIRNLSQRYEESKVAELETQLTGLEKRYADTLSNIYQVVQANSILFKILNPITNTVEEKTAYEWAVYLFEQSDYQTEFIKDKVSYITETNGLVENLLGLASIGNNLKQDEFSLLNYNFIPDDSFLQLNELRKIEIHLSEIKEKINIADYDSIQPNCYTEKLKTEIENIEKLYEQFQAQTIPNVLFNNQNFNLSLLKNILKQTEVLREQVKSANDKLLSYQLDLSAINETDPDILHLQINQLIVKFGESKTLGWLVKGLLDKNLKRLTGIDQLSIIEVELNKRKCLKQLSITFNNYLNSFGIPKQTNIQEAIKELDFTVHFNDTVSAFNNELKNKDLPQVSLSLSNVSSELTFLRNIKYYSDYINIIAFLKEEKKKLTSFAKPYPLIYKIVEAIENVDRASYEMYLSEYRRNSEKQILAFEFDKIYNRVFATLPLTANAIKSVCQSDKQIVLNKEVFEKDIFFLKVNNFLEVITNETKGSEKLLSNLQAVKRSIERQTADIISYKTWYHKSKNVSDTQKAALSAWLNDLINIGKGYGKNTARNIASAITNMQVAKGAVPIWIMPQATAVTFFPDASPNQFDLLIIDEASQCDISSLNLVFRCKKSLIVGDENQTSVVADKSIFTIDRTNELLDKYLISHKFKTQFDVNNKNNSIYTISGVIFPNIVTLTEHFRCLPEIIGYSNQYVYNSDIIPLKTATEYRFGEPVEIHYVEDNYFEEQKPLIVQKVVEEIENYILNFQQGNLRDLPSIGVLTLDSSNSKHQALLIRQISQNELIKQYEDKLELLIGTSREFQGDERDIMFLTITTSHSFNERTNEIRPPRAAATEEYMRIFNVAASRAKEKSVVVHSIHPDAVGIMNPECYRKKLLDYYSTGQSKSKNGNSALNLQSLLSRTDTNSGDFEKNVCRFLYDNGLGDYLFPQFEVGKYSIDFGIIKNNKKLAIECDGITYHSGIVKIQNDINRQLILERAGWRFFRIQSTDWFYRNSTVSRELINWINDNTTDK